jgi:predicted ATP-dependent serine protease
VPWLEKRVQEAKKMGFAHVIGPKLQKNVKKPGVEYLEALDVRSALNATLMKG